jgi:hypothetical protein
MASAENQQASDHTDMTNALPAARTGTATQSCTRLVLALAGEKERESPSRTNRHANNLTQKQQLDTRLSR